MKAALDTILCAAFREGDMSPFAHTGRLSGGPSALVNMYLWDAIGRNAPAEVYHRIAPALKKAALSISLVNAAFEYSIFHYIEIMSDTFPWRSASAYLGERITNGEGSAFVSYFQDRIDHSLVAAYSRPSDGLFLQHNMLVALKEGTNILDKDPYV